jgi:predicted nucleotide-binding protein
MTVSQDDLAGRIKTFRDRLQAYEQAVRFSSRRQDDQDWLDHSVARQKTRELQLEVQEMWGELRGDLQSLGAPRFFEIAGVSFPVFDQALADPHDMEVTYAGLALAIQAATQAIGAARARERQERKANEEAASVRSPVAARPSGSTKDRIFVGHGRSLVWLRLDKFLTSRLGLTVEEYNCVSTPGHGRQDRLKEMLEAAGFAFLVLTGEDELTDGTVLARQNVVHEAGLFQGHVGFERAIVLLEEGCTEFSNLAGLDQIRFPKGNIMAVSEDIRWVLEREGFLMPPIPQQLPQHGNLPPNAQGRPVFRFELKREETWYHTWRVGDSEFHLWRVLVDAGDVPLTDVEVFTEGPRFWDSHPLQVTGAQGHGTVTIRPHMGRHFDFLLEEVRDDGTIRLSITYATGRCFLRNPPLDGVLILTAANGPTVRIAFRIVHDDAGRAVPSFSAPI